MTKILNTEINLSFLVNPFYLYCIAFSFSILIYMLGWSKLYPPLSIGLILFMVISFVLFILVFKLFENRFAIKIKYYHNWKQNLHIVDLFFSLIIALGILNVALMGYIPVFDRSMNYLDFGIPVLDPIFNSMSIFFSVFFFQIYLESKKKRFFIYILVFLVLNLLIFRRSSVIWIITSIVFVYILYRPKVRILYIFILILCMPFFTFTFGLYGSKRSNLTKSYVINELEASDNFKKTGFNYNNYLTYLYISSPLANLQKNINESNGIFNKKEYLDFFLYNLVPQSITIRLEKLLDLSSPECYLIHPHLIVGTFLMISFYTLGWVGMISMLVFLLFFIILSLTIIRKWNIFGISTFCLLSTTVCLLIFSNFLNRLDVILMLLVYPVLFHVIFNIERKLNRVVKFE